MSLSEKLMAREAVLAALGMWECPLLWHLQKRA